MELNNQLASREIPNLRPNLFEQPVLDPSAKAGHPFCPFILRRQGGGWNVEVISSYNQMDHLIKRGKKVIRAAIEHPRPGRVKQNVADTGFTVQKNWNSTLEGLERRYSIALPGRHQEKMR